MEDSNCLANGTDWHELADRILEGHELTVEEGLSILRSDDDELLDLLAATYRVRRHHFGRKVHLYFLKNAKSGLCPEDCGYCSQSIISEAEIPRYALLNEAKLMIRETVKGASRARMGSRRPARSLAPAQKLTADSMKARAACFWATDCGRGCSIRRGGRSCSAVLKGEKGERVRCPRMDF